MGISNLWRAKRCKTCSRKVKLDEETADIRIKTTEGIHEIEVCLDCARFWDKSGDVLLRKRGGNDDESV